MIKEITLERHVEESTSRSNATSLRERPLLAYLGVPDEEIELVPGESKTIRFDLIELLPWLTQLPNSLFGGCDSMLDIVFDRKGRFMTPASAELIIQCYPRYEISDEIPRSIPLDSIPPWYRPLASGSHDKIEYVFMGEPGYIRCENIPYEGYGNYNHTKTILAAGFDGHWNLLPIETYQQISNGMEPMTRIDDGGKRWQVFKPTSGEVFGKDFKLWIRGTETPLRYAVLYCLEV